jgi:hypothetical protein
VRRTSSFLGTIQVQKSNEIFVARLFGSRKIRLYFTLYLACLLAEFLYSICKGWSAEFRVTSVRLEDGLDLFAVRSKDGLVDRRSLRDYDE